MFRTYECHYTIEYNTTKRLTKDLNDFNKRDFDRKLKKKKTNQFSVYSLLQALSSKHQGYMKY